MADTAGQHFTVSELFTRTITLIIISTMPRYTLSFAASVGQCWGNGPRQQECSGNFSMSSIIGESSQERWEEEEMGQRGGGGREEEEGEMG